MFIVRSYRQYVPLSEGMALGVARWMGMDDVGKRLLYKRRQTDSQRKNIFQG